MNACLNGGQCVPNGLGGFTCNCPNPYTGQRCEDRMYQLDNYAEKKHVLSVGNDPCASQPCRNGGTCQSLNGNTFQCICPSGYSGSDCSTRKFTSLSTVKYREKMRVVVGDPCANNPCLNGGVCVSNNFGGFTCQCPPGYSGPRCEDRKRYRRGILVHGFFLLCSD